MFGFFLPFAIGAKNLRIYFITMGFNSLRQQGFLLINNRQSKQHFKWQIVRYSHSFFAPACCSPNGTCCVVDHKIDWSPNHRFWGLEPQKNEPKLTPQGKRIIFHMSLFITNH